MKKSNPSMRTGWGLTPKLLIAFLLTAVLPVTAASVFSLNYYYGVAFEDVKRNLGKELGTARLLIDEWGRRAESDTRLASRENVVALNLSLGLTAPVLEYLETLRSDRHLALAYLLDASGRRLDRVSAGPVGPPLDSVREHLAQARTRNGVSFPATFEGRILLLSLVPVTDESGRTSYFLLTGVDPASGEVGRILDTIRQVVSGPVVFVDARGLLGAAPGTPRWESVRWPTTDPEAGTLVPAVSQGATYLFGFARVSTQVGVPAWVGVSFSLDSFQQVANAAAGGLIIIAFLCVSLSCVAAVGFSRGLTRPLMTMAREANAWTAGQGGNRLNVTSKDETGALGRAFNEVLDRLDVTMHSLRKTQNYLKNIFNSLTSVLVSIDENGTVQEWNVAAERFSGTKAADAIGRTVWSLSQVFAGLGTLLERAIATREPQYIKKGFTRGQERRSYDMCLYPLVWNGVSGAVIRMDDITESLKKDRQLLQAQKMETIGTLTEGVAHNFNNLLTGITGTVSVVRLELADNRIDREHMHGRMSMIEDSARKASEIVHRLMALTKGGTGDFAATDLALVLRETCETSRMVIDNAVELEFSQIPRSAPVYGDRSQLEQCLLNLIINASHAMTFMRPQGEHLGGTIRVTLQTMTAVNDFLASHPEAVQSDYWLLQVHDEGVGISPENLPKIFDPFFTTKETGKGSGLGMAMVYASIRQHNGFIDVYSEVGRGTTVNLYLPAVKLEIPPGPAPAPRGPAVLYPGEGLILVVDDESLVQNTARMILQACGYEVLLANNGLEAVSLYQHEHGRIRAVLLDSSMPKLSGAETLEALRLIDPEVKVVMSSGLFDGKRQESSEGSLRFLPKPYSLSDLSRILNDLLGGAK